MPKIVINELLVAGSFLLAGIPIGCSLSYPSVLLHQLKSNDSSIQLDWETATWIGSVNGLVVIPSILTPIFMQWRGRKTTFIIATLVAIIGWIVAYTAKTTTAILVSEFIHGYGSQSVMGIGMLSMSEMISPQSRNVIMGLYVVIQSLGMAAAGIIGSYVHWRTLTLVVCAPLIVVIVVVAVVWPESPSWLAYKGEFEKCAKAFKRLRGTSAIAQAELQELILAQKEILASEDNKQNKNLLRYFWMTIHRRDFYVPLCHIFILFDTLYWIGGLAIFIYSSDLIPRVTHIVESVYIGMIGFNVVIMIGCITSVVLFRYFKQKNILLTCGLTAVGLLLSVAGINYSQNIGFMVKESYISLYLLIVFTYITNVCIPIVTTMGSEVIPVKHRGISGPIVVLLNCGLQTSLMKTYPYFIKYLDVWGTFILYATNGLIGHIIIWKIIPETKGRTLQQIEDFYTYGNIDKSRKLEPEETLDELISTKE